MSKSVLVGGICFFLGAITFAFAQATGLRPDQFIARPWTWSAIQTFGTPVGFLKISPPGSPPGASGGQVSLVCGTLSGTAKLIVSAGTGGSVITIVDNVGSGVSGC